MAELLNYVEHLSEAIGPRPATTDAEERAAHYIRDVFEARGLETETQHFDSPRTYSWTYVVYYVLTIAAAVLSRFSPLAALALGTAVAVILWLDLDTRWGLGALMPKGPSQNIIARHVPKTGRNERVAKIVVVAHYDSARTSLAFSPGMVKNFAATFGLMKWCTYLVPVFIALRMILGGFKLSALIEPWAWYVTLVPAAYLIVPLLINVHRELFMRFSPGANDNASGVAALLGVMERLVPEPEAAAFMARESRRAKVEEEASAEDDLFPEESLLNFAPIAAPAAAAATWTDDDDISWDTGVITGQTSLGLDSAPASTSQRSAPEVEGGPRVPTQEQSMRLFGTAFPSSKRGPAAADAEDTPAAQRSGAPDLGFDIDLDEDTAPFQVTGGTTAEPPAPAHERHGLRDWLGLGGDFDARRKGKEIGSWDNFEEDEDESGWKGGSASIDDAEDSGYTASVVARIRRKVTTAVDRDLVEKEVWFVSTGAEEVGTVGMKAFLAEYGDDLRDAAIINLDNIGSGAVAYVTREGMAKLYSADRRLVGATRRAIREADLPVKGREYRGLSTDATPALARGFRAMSVMAFDINGRLPNWHWSTDTVENVSETNIEMAVDLVTAIMREL